MYQTIKGAALSCLAAPFVFVVPHCMIDEMSAAAEADRQAGLSCFYLRKLTKMVEAPLFFMCILRFYVPVDLFVSLCGNDPAVVKVSGDTIRFRIR